MMTYRPGITFLIYNKQYSGSESNVVDSDVFLPDQVGSFLLNTCGTYLMSKFELTMMKGNH